MTIRPVNIASVDFASGVNSLLRQFRAQEQQRLEEDSLRATTAHRNRMFDRLVANDAQAQENFNTRLGFQRERAQVQDARALAQAEEDKRRFGVNTGLRQQQIAAQRENAAANRAFQQEQFKANQAARRFQQNISRRKLELQVRKLEQGTSGKTGKVTDAQSKAAGFARRTLESDKLLSDPKVVAAATSVSERTKALLPGGNFLVTESFQKFDQAQRDFINAILRRESGAVISDQEFDNARKQYFPAPGDSKVVIEQKKRNRHTAIQGLVDSSGPLSGQFQPPSTQAPQSTQFTEGQTATNPQTGERIVFQSGAWVPAQ